MPSTYRGTLGKFHGSYSSGIAFIEINGSPVPCENAPTVRALEHCFGNVIQPDHTASSRSFEGREVVYSLDDFGLLLSFTPADQGDGPEIPENGLHEEGE